MKKYIVIGLIFAVIVTLSVLFIVSDPFDMYWDEGEPDDYDKDIEQTNDFYSKIYVYGQKLQLRDSLNYTILDKIDEESIPPCNKGEHRWLIINDFNGKVQLSDEEIQFISKSVLESGLSFFYIGSQYIPEWNDNIVYYTNGTYISKTQKSAVFESLPNGVMGVDGVVDNWVCDKYMSGEDSEILGKEAIALLANSKQDYEN